ncbi:FUSC family protein [Dongshaea marina]|uniref:FUSC family protein n=1 Tax=Dongshaea marina TaxID=2047966 RepID=UPI000D3E4513|nr:FUSC family protein [Dongshaea marina]
MRPFISPEIICRYHRFWHSGRICLAMIFALLLIHLTQIPHGVWMMVTIVVVMGPVSHVGGIKGRAKQRFMGTILGALAGLFPMLIPGFPFWLFMIWIVAWVGASSYYALGRNSYAALIVGLTLVIVTGAGVVDLQPAIWRTTNVIIGDVIALVFSGVFAHRAHDHWRYLLAENLRDFMIFYKAQVTDMPLRESHIEKLLGGVKERLNIMRGLQAPLRREHSIYSPNGNAVIAEQRRILSTLELIQKTRVFSEKGHRCIVFLHQLRRQKKELVGKMDLLYQQIYQHGVVSSQDFQFDHLSLVKQLRKSDENEHVLSPFGYIWLNRHLSEQLNRLYQLLPKRDYPQDEPLEQVEKSVTHEDALGKAGVDLK